MRTAITARLELLEPEIRRLSSVEMKPLLETWAKEAAPSVWLNQAKARQLGLTAFVGTVAVCLAAVREEASKVVGTVAELEVARNPTLGVFEPEVAVTAEEDMGRNTA